MDIQTTLLVYKIAVLVVGLALVWMGYRLFQSGIFNSSGDVEAVWKDRRLLIRNAAPGMFFVIAGALVIAKNIPGVCSPPGGP